MANSRIAEGVTPDQLVRLDSPDEASDIVNALPVVKRGLVTFDIDPIATVMRL